MSSTDATIAYYDHNAASFVDGTVHASMGDALSAFAALLPAGGRVLDWGCGSGRDARALRQRGFAVTSVDASPAMCAEALRATGTTVRLERFDELADRSCYDGIWACASLLHALPDELPGLFGRAADALVNDGVLYCSFKYGTFTGQRGGRWFTDLDEETLFPLLEPRFDVLRLWQSGDVRPGRSSELWLNCLARRR